MKNAFVKIFNYNLKLKIILIYCMVNSQCYGCPKKSPILKVKCSKVMLKVVTKIKLLTLEF